MRPLRQIVNAFALCIAVPLPVVFGQTDGRPNIVLIISDDQAYHDFSFMGHPDIHTPHLDRLASQSVVFTRGYVTTALCCPSLGTMLTGTYPHQHGFTGNDPVDGWGAREAWVDHFAQLPQLPRLMSEAGYLVLQTGKYWQGDPEKISGFTHSLGKTLRQGSEASLGVGRDTMQPIYDFIDEARDRQKPFMVWYAPFLPHTPHTPPERLLKKYQGQGLKEYQEKYYAMVDWLDETCGDLLSYLDDEGLRKDTIVMFISDNGWPHGEAGFRGHVSKLTPWEQGVRTPIMIRWPGKVKPLMDEVDLASNIDIPVTILEAAGVSVPATMSGLNLLDLDAVKARDCVFIEDFAHDMVAPERPEATLEARGVIAGEWKLVESYVEEQGEVPGTYLFHVTADPKEVVNLADQHPEKVHELKRKLDAWWAPSGNAGTVIENAKPSTSTGAAVTKQFVFKRIDDVDLQMKIWYPPNWTSESEKLPAVVLFFGGGWVAGGISQFNGIAPHLSRRGMVVVTPEYRTKQEHGAEPRDCLQDANSAMRYVYANADTLGIDADRIAAGGRSAGGHLAAATAFCEGFDAEDDDLSITRSPTALILYNPVIDNGPDGFGHDRVKEYWEAFSPLHNISDTPPPTIFITGDQDQHTPIETARKFQSGIEQHGGRCELVVFEGGKHGSPFARENSSRTQNAVDKFLVSLGYLEERN